MHIYAKSSRKDGRQSRLGSHSRETMVAFEVLFGTHDAPSRLGRAWLRFFRIPSGEFARFYETTVAACGFHDLGKANSGFADMVTGKRSSTGQAIRHEHLSVLLLLLPDVESWLTRGTLVDMDVLLAAVGGHHLKSAGDQNPERLYAAFAEAASPFALDTFRVYGEADDFHEIFGLVAARLGLPSGFVPAVAPIWSRSGAGGQNVELLRQQLVARFRALKRHVTRDPLRKRMLAAVKAAVIVADTAASGLIREDQPLRDWLGAAFSNSNVLTSDDIDNVLARRIAQIEKNPTSAFRWQDFQDGAATLGPRALLLAGCGSGKTLAAWRWIKARVISSEISRVLFLYPTRGTATEGFRDYISWAPEEDGALLHGTARFDLDGMFSNPDDSRDPRGGRCYEPEERLFAVGYWKKRVFSATVDQFLGFMRQGYRSICLLPLLADSVVVIDEVHSFDSDLFVTLKAFLKTFDVPVLCMTASLTKRRRDDLAELGLEVYPGNSARFKELETRMNAPRYRVHLLPDRATALGKARERYGEGKRVLIVVNTIARCQELAKELDALCYHSGFKLSDRRNSHQKVVEAFQQESTAVLAVTTQVCEMSLDLDAEVLVTEEAPISSLIQRMGRCNRKGRTQPGEVFIYKPEAQAPYGTTDLTGVAEFLRKVDSREVSQACLEDLLKLGPQEPELLRYERFLDDGPWAGGGYDDLRDIDESGVRAILDSDIGEYRARVHARRETDGLVLSIRRHLTWEEPGLGWLRVADATRYSKRYGFQVGDNR